MPISHTSAEQEAICNAWKQSGISKIKFCKQSNISKSALYTWLNKFNNNVEVPTPKTYNKRDIQSTAVKFLRINDINSDKVLHSASSVLEITMPNGVDIKVNLSQSNFNIFMQELLKWK